MTVCLSLGREQKQLPLENIPILAKDSPGEQLVKLKQKEKIISVYMT
jgi:hypothetical protein